MKTVRTLTSVATLAVVLTLTGCGSDDDAGAAATNSPSQDASATPPAGGGLDEGQLEEMRECLEAAGLEDALPTDMPSGAPSDMPSDMPTDMPSDFDPENPPEGFPSEGAQGQGGALGALQDPEVQDALEACGIELPQRPSGSSS